MQEENHKKWTWAYIGVLATLGLTILSFYLFTSYFS